MKSIIYLDRMNLDPIPNSNNLVLVVVSFPEIRFGLNLVSWPQRLRCYETIISSTAPTTIEGLMLHLTVILSLSLVSRITSS